MTRKGTTKAGGQKHALDKFYTKPAVAAQCLAMLDLTRFSRIIEPSAGGGAFSDLLLDAGLSAQVVALDLEPENPRVRRQDWFGFTERAPGSTLVVGNPPFGQQCSLALAFINHAFTAVHAEVVAFILPRSFRKASVQSRVFANAELVVDVLLGPNSFEFEGADYNLPAVFQVWRRTDSPRPTTLGALTSEHIAFTKKDEPHDFAVRRVGGRAGHAFRDTGNASPQSNYFVRVLADVPVDQVVDMVNALDFSVADDGTGPRTLSKRELVALVDAEFDKLCGRRARAA